MLLIHTRGNRLMQAEPSTVRNVQWNDAAAIVELAGEIDMHQTPSTHRAIVAICQRRPQPLVIDLRDVPYIDSSGIGMLVEIFRRVKGYGGSLRLCGLGERVISVFEVTKLDKFFSIYPGQAEALAG